MKILIVVVIAFILGCFIGDKKLFKANKQKIDEDEIREKKEQYKKMKKSFSELMNYDYDVAVGSDKQ